jgi:hypothetical protein
MKCSPNQNNLGIELLVACALVGECNHGVEKLFVLGRRALVEKVLYNVDGRHLMVDIETSMAFQGLFTFTSGRRLRGRRSAVSPARGDCLLRLSPKVELRTVYNLKRVYRMFFKAQSDPLSHS